MYFVLGLMLFSGLSNATVRAPRADCPEQFKGRVQEIIDEVGPSNPFSVQKVVFHNLQTIKGEGGEQVQVNVLKHGPVNFEVGKDYQVQARNGRLCWVDKL